MTVKEMCSSCIHRFYCMAAFNKDHWCGNYKKEVIRNDYISSK